ncbi:hypothetical protein [Nonomuraea rosea]|uniref:aromatic-ring hydroxylase C-terminal domain-containing protein n=1 Tax=Nonomuraea rosea TaxID=638574 RepID=UPI0031F060BC
MFEKTSGSSIRYDLGSEQPLVGRSAPDLRLEDGTRLGDLLQDGRGGALDFSTGRRLHGSATGWASRIRYAAGPASNDLGFGAVLVRPDGVVAWAGDRDPDPAAFEQAAAHWFGRSSHPLLLWAPPRARPQPTDRPVSRQLIVMVASGEGVRATGPPCPRARRSRQSQVAPVRSQ